MPKTLGSHRANNPFQYTPIPLGQNTQNPIDVELSPSQPLSHRRCAICVLLLGCCCCWRSEVLSNVDDAHLTTETKGELFRVPPRLKSYLWRKADSITIRWAGEADQTASDNYIAWLCGQKVSLHSITTGERAFMRKCKAE